MPKSFTDAFHIDKKIFELCGALDIILDVDTKYLLIQHWLEYVQFQSSMEQS